MDKKRQYCSMRRKQLVVVHFVKYFRHYLVRKKFILRTDHPSLRWIRSFSVPWTIKATKAAEIVNELRPMFETCENQGPNTETDPDTT
jgi:hypothetical protein